VPIERGEHALAAVAARRDETRNDEQQHQRAYGERIAQADARRRPARTELLGRKQRALAMRLPERLRNGIVAVGSHGVSERRGGPMRLAGSLIDAIERVPARRHPKAEEREGGEDEQHREDRDRCRTRQRGKDEPQAGPGQREEEPEHGRHGGERRPQPLPEQAAACPLQSPGQQQPGLVARPIVHAVQKALLARPGQNPSVTEATMRNRAGPRVFRKRTPGLGWFWGGV
jgi:hypothetical protein